MDDFLILIQTQLDKAALKGTSENLDQLRKDFAELRIKPVIDQQALSNIVKQLESITGKKITISNIATNTNQINKTGKQIASDINKTIQNNLNIDTVVTNALKKMSQLSGRDSNIIFANRLNSVSESLKNNQELMELFNKAVSQSFNISSLDNLVSILRESQNEMLSTEEIAKQFNATISSQFTTTIPASQKIRTNIFEVCRAFQQFNNETKNIGDQTSGKNFFNWLSKNASQAQKDIFKISEGFRSFESVLNGLSVNNGNLFNYSTTLGLDTLNYNTNEIEKLLQSESKLISESDHAEKELQELRDVLISTFAINTSSDGTLSVTLDQLQRIAAQCPQAKKYIDEINSSLVQITQNELNISDSSTSSTNKVIQNEEKKQQAYQQTAKTQTTANNQNLDLNDNTKKIEQFKQSLAELGTVDSKYVDKLSDRFGKLDIQIQSINASLSEVAVHEKGEYMGTKEILSSTLQGIDKYGQAITLTEQWDLTNHEFVKSLDAVGASFQDVQKHVTTYQTKLNDFKTKYSNANVDYSGFEKVLSDFQKGIGTVDDLKLSFNQLENSAKLGVQSLKSQSSSFDPIQQALNNMRDMPSMLKTLEASMSEVKDKTSLAGISVKDLTDKYNALQSEMSQNDGKVPLTEKWTSDYRELMSTVTSATKQVEALKKAEASDNSQATKQANYYSSILVSYRQMYDIKKKLLTAGEEESKVLAEQRRSLSISIASNYKQLNKQGLIDKDWQSQVDALKKSLDYGLRIAEAHQKDIIANKEASKIAKETAQAEKERLATLEKQRAATANAAKAKARESSQQELTQQKEINAILSKQQSVYKEIWDINKQITSLDPDKNQNQINALKEKKKYYQDIYLSAQKELQAYNNISVSQEHLNSLTEIRKKAQAEISVAVAKQNETLANKIQLSIETNEYESKVESLIAKTQQWTDVNGDARISTTNLSVALNELATASEAYANNPTEATQKRLIESGEKLDAEYKKITNSVRSMNAEMAKDSSIISLHNKVADFMSKNSKAVKYSGEFKRIFNETAQGAELTRQQVAKLNQEFNNAVVSARQAGKLGKTFFQTLREGMSSFSYWTSSTFLVMKAIQSVKGGISTVKALDTALVDLKKTTTMTASELEDFYYSSNKVAKQMGVTTEEIINQASAWSRLGFSSGEAATKMAKLSSQFASISPGMDVDEATTSLVSMIRAYDVEVDDVLDGIMSRINEVGNKFGTSNAEIAEGLRKSSAAMAAVGGTIESNIALFTGAQEIVQDASQVGNAIRSIALRVRSYDEETEEFSEDLANIKGEVIDLTKVASNNGQGISLFTDSSQTEYKDLVQYLGEISDIWNEIDAKSQNELLNKLFGKNRANTSNIICPYVQKCA